MSTFSSPLPCSLSFLAQGPSHSIMTCMLNLSRHATIIEYLRLWKQHMCLSCRTTVYSNPPTCLFCVLKCVHFSDYVLTQIPLLFAIPNVLCSLHSAKEVKKERRKKTKERALRRSLCRGIESCPSAQLSWGWRIVLSEADVGTWGRTNGSCWHEYSRRFVFSELPYSNCCLTDVLIFFMLNFWLPKAHVRRIALFRQ